MIFIFFELIGLSGRACRNPIEIPNRCSREPFMGKRLWKTRSRIVAENNNPKKQGSLVVSTASLAPGTYIVKVITNTGETQLRKFIKE